MLERAIEATRDFFANMRGGVREQRVVRHIVAEMQSGKRFDEVLAEPYVLNNTSEDSRARLVEKPEIVEGIENQLAGRLYQYKVDYAVMDVRSKKG
jgi:hypothetical protein